MGGTERISDFGINLIKSVNLGFSTPITGKFSPYRPYSLSTSGLSPLFPVSPSPSLLFPIHPKF